MQCTLFPHETVRSQQDQLISAVLETIDRKGQLVVHAPTGLGKTAATLAPAIERAIMLNKVVVFMTSRLTQHALALETVQKIRKRHNVHIPVVDLIGKKHMCLQPGVERLTGKEFAEYCKAMREDDLCEHYKRLKTGEQFSSTTKSVLVQLGKQSPNTPEQVKYICAEEEHRLCPYEIQMIQAKDARVIITDYSYIFNESIRDSFLARINRELADCILIIDEGHNLPDRIKDLATEKISTLTIRRAIGELQKHHEEDHKHHLTELQELLSRLAQNMQDERYVGRDEFLTHMQRICKVEQLIDDLEKVAQAIREEQKASSCGTIADFLTAWSGDDSGYTRILSRKEKLRGEAGGDSQEEDKSSQEAGQHTLFGKRAEEPFVNAKTRGFLPSMPSAARTGVPVELRYRCMDPSIITKPIFDEAHSTIVMSGTLTPTSMYAQLLGTTDARELTLLSPFPQENRLNIIIPKTTTKFTTRSSEMYAEIANLCAQVVESVPGNSAVFFPSYQLLEEVKGRMETKVAKTVFTEHPSFTKEEREELLARFRQYKHTGAVLLGVMGGSFSEGIDLPGDELRAVVIVGLPLGRPDLETKALIDYYQAKFGRGWDYGYTYPAFNKTLQSAGRCIRTETDRGAIIFIDERYAWQNYYSCFPREWHIRITLKHLEMIRAFFALRH